MTHGPCQPEPLRQRLARLGRADVRLGLVGGAIAHSRSPALHEAHLREAGLPGRYELFPCADAAAAAAVVARLEAGELDGLNVTLPFKAWAADRCRDQAPAAAVPQGAPPSVNTLCADATGRLYGYSTDGAGLLDAVAAAGLDVRGLAVAVIGLGGAGLAILHALRGAGVARVAVANRTAAPARRAARQQAEWRRQVRADAAPAGPPVTAIPWGDGRRLGGADLVLHATALGHGHRFLAPLRPADPHLPAWAAGRKHWESAAFAQAALDLAWLPWPAWRARGTVVFDAVYAPGATWFQAAALQHGLGADLRLLPGRIVPPEAPHGVLIGSGDAMLVRQAARSFALWCGAVGA